MVIKETELKNILLFTLKPYFDKYGFKYVNSHLKIDDFICLDMTLLYNNQTITVNVMFILDYEKKYIVFKNIKGLVKYSFLELSFMQLFRQIVNIPLLIVKEDSCLYPVKLPIESINMAKNEIEIKIRE